VCVMHTCMSVHSMHVCEFTIAKHFRDIFFEDILVLVFPPTSIIDNCDRICEKVHVLIKIEAKIKLL